MGGAVPNKWGGAFGQEWVASALRSLPSAAGRSGGLELETQTCGFAPPPVNFDGLAAEENSVGNEESSKTLSRKRKLRIRKVIAKQKVKKNKAEAVVAASSSVAGASASTGGCGCGTAPADPTSTSS